MMTTVELINACPMLSHADKVSLLSACATRGKWKGYVLANCPKEENRKIAWLAIMMHLASARVPMSALLSDTASVMRLNEEIERAWLDDGINAAERPFRWNLWHHRYDAEKSIDRVFDHWGNQ